AERFLGRPAAAGQPGHRVRTAAGEAAALGGDPLQASAVRLFWLSVGATALFALLALLLTLLRAGPERAALLARLRTMGLRPRQGLALVLTEVLPQALVAALGGALIAVCCVRLLGPALDLSPLVGSDVPTGLRLLAGPIARQALGLALLAALAVVAEAAVTARRQISTELRAGDAE
ncbi:ABC transporter permease, partial [Kitasatospora sp. NPDC057198]